MANEPKGSVVLGAPGAPSEPCLVCLQPTPPLPGFLEDSGSERLPAHPAHPSPPARSPCWPFPLVASGQLVTASVDPALSVLLLFISDRTLPVTPGCHVRLASRRLMTGLGERPPLLQLVPLARCWLFSLLVALWPGLLSFLLVLAPVFATGKPNTSL